MLLTYQTRKPENTPPHHFQCLAELSGVLKKTLPDIRDMKVRIKRQDVEYFRKDLSTEKIGCHIKCREVKDTSLSFGIIFFICIGILKTEAAYVGLVVKIVH